MFPVIWTCTICVRTSEKVCKRLYTGVALSHNRHAWDSFQQEQFCLLHIGSENAGPMELDPLLCTGLMKCSSLSMHCAAQGRYSILVYGLQYSTA